MEIINLSGNNILITGANGNIGKAVSQACIDTGAAVFCTDIQDISVLDTEYIKCDMLDMKEIELLVDQLPVLDSVICCAGCTQLIPAGFYKQKSVDAIIDLNLKSPILLINRLLKKKKINSGASLVLFASTAAVNGVVGNGLYAAAKSGLIGLSKVWAKELSRKKIRCNCVSPGIVETDMLKKHHDDEEIKMMTEANPLGMGQVEDVVSAVKYLISDSSKWVTGTNMIVDGGYLVK